MSGSRTCSHWFWYSFMVSPLVLVIFSMGRGVQYLPSEAKIAYMDALVSGEIPYLVPPMLVPRSGDAVQRFAGTVQGVHLDGQVVHIAQVNLGEHAVQVRVQRLANTVRRGVVA